MIVVDTDVLFYLIAPTKRSQFAAAVRLRDAHWIAPANQRVELLNVMSKSVRGRQMSFEKAVEAFRRSAALCLIDVLEVPEEALLKLSVELNTTTYDSAYVWLARQKALRLVTGDQYLVQCAPDVAVSLEDFASGK